MSIHSTLSKLVGEHNTSGQFVMTCPACGKDRHFFINTTTGKSWCHKCEVRGSSWKDTLRLLKAKEDTDVSFFPRQSKIPSVIRFPEEATTNFSLEARAYLADRDVSAEVVRNYHITYCPSGKYAMRLIIPVTNEGKIAYFVARTINPQEKLRYLYPEGQRSHLLFNFDKVKGLLDENKTCIIVEGIFDILPHEYLRKTAVALLGSSLSRAQEYRLMSTFRRVFVWLDPDKLKEAWEIGRKLNADGCVVFIVEQEKGSDPGDCPDILREIKKNSVICNAQTYIERKVR